MAFAEAFRLNLLEKSVARLDAWTRRRSRRAGLPQHLVTGLDGEDAAFFHLRRNGYTVVARRWSSGEVPGDVDLIAWQGPMLCFIEVKTRTARDERPAESAVDQHKRNILRRLARRYVRQLPQPLPPPVRFDVMSVYLVPGEPRQIDHFTNAFGWSEGRERD
ncbi:MAG TPA: YraN family protein [Terracidiphilus sp.]|nr:YraN family protein [Terracidiphilus sp.]